MLPGLLWRYFFQFREIEIHVWSGLVAKKQRSKAKWSETQLRVLIAIEEEKDEIRRRTSTGERYIAPSAHSDTKSEGGFRGETVEYLLRSRNPKMRTALYRHQSLLWTTKGNRAKLLALNSEGSGIEVVHVYMIPEWHSKLTFLRIKPAISSKLEFFVNLRVNSSQFLRALVSLKVEQNRLLTVVTTAHWHASWPFAGPGGCPWTRSLQLRAFVVS